MRPLAILTLGTLLVGACTTYTPGPFPSSATTTYGITVGAPTSVSPGVQAGYGIAANTGGSYRIVWTGDAAVSGTYTNFQGSVWTPGTFLSVTPGCLNGYCALESGDFVSDPINVSGGQRIDWDTTATTGLDGLDFVTDGSPIYFDCLIDGVRHTDLIQFPSGASGTLSVPSVSPFGLTPQ